MSEAVVIGIDIGTSAIKAGVYRLSGDAVATASAPLALDRDLDGNVTQNLDGMYAEAARACREAITAAGIDAELVKAVAISGQMAGVGFVDDNHQPVGAYDSWLDTRCGELLATVDANLSQRILETSGAMPTFSIGAKVAWWNRFQPAALDGVAAFVTAGGYVAGRMAGLKGSEAFIDQSYLHFTSVADSKKGEWDEELATSLGVPLNIAPRIVKSTDIIGSVTEDAASDFSLCVGTPVMAGCGDTAAAAVGSDVLRPGGAFDVAGTAAVLGIRLPAFAHDASGLLSTMRCPLSDGAFALAYVGGAGELVDWLSHTLLEAPEGDYSTLRDAIESVPAGSGGVIVTPHLSGRVAPASPHLTGAIVGLTPAHDKRHIARAALEAIAYEYRSYAVAANVAVKHAGLSAEVSEVTGMGGGTKLEAWNAIKADVLGATYRSLVGVDAGTRGAAIIAIAGLGHVVPHLDNTALSAPTEPAPHRHQTYSDGFERYLQWTAHVDQFTSLPNPIGGMAPTLTEN